MSIRRMMLLGLGEFSIDPILLGQPKLWIYPSDPNYLLDNVGSVPVDGDPLNIFYRFNDSAFNPTQATTTNRAIYSVLAGQPHPYGYVRWEGGTLTVGGNYRVGTNTDFAFLHQINSAFTVYWINKNDPSENTASTKVVLGTSVSSTNNGTLLTVGNTTNTLRKRAFTVYRGVSGTSACSISESTNYIKTTDYPVRLDSIRCDLSKSLGQTCSEWFINGVLDNTDVMNNLPSSSATSTNVMNIGNRNSGGLRHVGSIGDLIIFDTIHDDDTHRKVCNFLMQKWGII